MISSSVDIDEKTGTLVQRFKPGAGLTVSITQVTIYIIVMDENSWYERDPKSYQAYFNELLFISCVEMLLLYLRSFRQRR